MAETVNAKDTQRMKALDGIEDSDQSDVQQTDKVERQPVSPDGRPCLVVLHGANIGASHCLEGAQTVVGRISAVEIQLVEESVSRRHAVVQQESGGFSVHDLGSTNGTFVNDRRVEHSEVRSGDLIQIGDTTFKFLSGETIESQYHDDIYRLSTFDSLTQAFNKRFFLNALECELNRSSRHGGAVSLVLLDIDRFKQINDTHGHLAGDRILMELASVVQRNIRKEDIVARFGGEEFAVVLPETIKDGARRVCEKLRALVEGHAFEYKDTKIPVTISLGGYTLEHVPRDADVDAMISRADAKLYEAKQAGRNCVRC